MCIAFISTNPTAGIINTVIQSITPQELTRYRRGQREELLIGVMFILIAAQARWKTKPSPETTRVPSSTAKPNLKLKAVFI
jgi:hypothetical protein